MTIDEAKRAAERAGRPDQLLERLAELVGSRARIETVFGTPITSGDLTVVPVARMRWGFGGGGGASDRDGASGSGGGGGLAADPVGYLEIGPTGATYRPIARPWTNPGFLLAAAIGAAVVIRAITRLRR